MDWHKLGATLLKIDPVAFLEGHLHWGACCRSDAGWKFLLLCFFRAACHINSSLLSQLNLFNTSCLYFALKTLQMGAFQDGSARFHPGNLSHPSAFHSSFNSQSRRQKYSHVFSSIAGPRCVYG